MFVDYCLKSQDQHLVNFLKGRTGPEGAVLSQVLIIEFKCYTGNTEGASLMSQIKVGKIGNA